MRAFPQTLTTGEFYSQHFEYRLAPSPGSHTYKARVLPVNTGVIRVYAGSFIQVIEV